MPIYLTIFWISNAVNKKWQRKLMEDGAELEAQFVESINGAGTIKRFGLEQYSGLHTESKFITLLRSIYKSSLKAFHLNNAAEFFTRLFTIAILWLGSYFVIQRDLSPGELLSFYALIGYFTAPAAALISANKNVQDALIAADRLFEIIDLQTETTDESKIILTADMINDIHFNDVIFRYGTRVLVFENLNLVIKKSQITAIVGESGSGKSTIGALIQNIYPLTQGSITIGGVDIKYVDHISLRKLISVVPQHIDLFKGTIIDNIAIGDYEPDLQKIFSLCQMLGINEFIEKLPDNYYTILNENGTNLSGGQKQRIAIARALYIDPEILILDEATSSLDPESEQRVQDTLTWFKNRAKTIIIIAHRLSTIKNCDEILMLKTGKLVEQGSHDTLINKNAHYASFWNYQLGLV